METKSNSKNYLWAAIIVLMTLLTIERCNKPEQSVAQTQTALEAKSAKTDTFLIEVPSKPKIVYITKYKFVPVDKECPVDTAQKIVEVPIKVDSSLLLSKYYAKNYQIIETPLDPGYTSIVTVDMISRNKIIARRTYLKTFKKRPDWVNVYLVASEKPKKGEWYVGAGTSVSKDYFNSLYGGVLYKNKHDEIYQLNAGIVNRSPLGEFTPYIGASIYFKVSK